LSTTAETIKFTLGVFGANAYILRDYETGECALIDTGDGEDFAKKLVSFKPKPNIKAILLTHAHVDHAGGLFYLQKIFNAKTYLSPKERLNFDFLPRQGTMLGMPELNCPCGRIDQELHDGDVIKIGKTEITFLEMPGHTPGSGCFLPKPIFSPATCYSLGASAEPTFPAEAHKICSKV
jgi:hydroxyacylglutathione hydrolase